jgi:hypothetical protein
MTHDFTDQVEELARSFRTYACGTQDVISDSLGDFLGWLNREGSRTTISGEVRPATLTEGQFTPSDGRTCGICKEPGHNARTCTTRTSELRGDPAVSVSIEDDEDQGHPDIVSAPGKLQRWEFMKIKRMQLDRARAYTSADIAQQMNLTIGDVNKAMLARTWEEYSR